MNKYSNKSYKACQLGLIETESFFYFHINFQTYYSTLVL